MIAEGTMSKAEIGSGMTEGWAVASQSEPEIRQQTECFHIAACWQRPTRACNRPTRACNRRRSRPHVPALIRHRNGMAKGMDCNARVQARHLLACFRQAHKTTNCNRIQRQKNQRGQSSEFYACQARETRHLHQNLCFGIQMESMSLQHACELLDALFWWPKQSSAMPVSSFSS